MKRPFIETLRTREGWQSAFAFRVYHRPPEEWVKMKWGFNNATLLEEALDRQRLFIESQALTEAVYFDNIQPLRTLALRGINIPGLGLQMTILGKIVTAEEETTLSSAERYATEIASICPIDFIFEAAQTKADYEIASGKNLFTKNLRVKSIHRENTFIPPMRGFHYLTGTWNSPPRSNEQIWRALAGTEKPALFNILLQPTILLQEERELLLEIKSNVTEAKEKPPVFLPYHAWVQKNIERRLSPWQKFFQMQVHILSDHSVDENLLRAIGSAITRDEKDSTLPGFQVQQPQSSVEENNWIEDIYEMIPVPPQRRLDELADIDEVSSVFRLPLRPETGLPGASFAQHPILS